MCLPGRSVATRRAVGPPSHKAPGKYRGFSTVTASPLTFWNILCIIINDIRAMCTCNQPAVLLPIKDTVKGKEAEA